ncbi:MAG: kelch repeat-containing protein, partial [bacterium]
MTTLPDGRVLVTAGEIDCDGCNALTPEIYDPATNKWTELPGAPLDIPYYPHMFVLPDGQVLASSTTEDSIVTRALSVSNQTSTVIDPVPVDGGSAAMFLPGKVVKSGTSTNPDDTVVPAAATTYVLDMTQPSPVWRETAPMAFARAFHTLTLLPDGNVLVTGGGPTTDAIGLSSAVKAAELWSPVTETWTTLASMQKPRLYHSTALLLSDARVLVAGGGRWTSTSPDASDQLSAEIYSPPYLFKGARPVITSAPTQIGYGSSMTVQTADAAQIVSVVLVKLGSVT